ncbi:peroxin 26 [Arthroderma uncinatum]|uniref:peroxin 26 n=1 Tax=Arthroderma uncinatum TaxID=74035 RepID=UPI00144AA374|nr:peroxin 26 [Arthroderma uncinatum]KAF3483345.1 peroxin 26 [Arthroderma uncinatum]
MADEAQMSQSYLSSSTSSLVPMSSKQISQVYKQASQLFLTRRLQESLSLLEPIITPSPSQETEQENGDGDSPTPPQLAPITTASSNLKIKIWNLYITILSAVVDLGPEEGRAQFGQKEWKAIATKVREGEVWETVVSMGYRGREGSVDADIVYNLATLLLNHSASQKLNQERLETYLSSYGQPDLDVAAHLQHLSSGKRKQRMTSAAGTDTPKDLAVRVKLLEIFTLHVLPRNDEWEYAREFINLSEALDDDRKEAFIQTLDNLQEEKERGAQRAAEIQQEKEEELERQRKQREDEERLIAEEEREKQEREQKQKRQQESSSSSGGKSTSNHKRSSSEVDYGIEKSNPNSAMKTRVVKPALKKSTSSEPSSAKQTKKSTTGKSQPLLLARMRVLANLLVTFMKNLARSLASNPLSYLKSLLVVLGVLMALGRSDVRNRIRQVTGAGWQKVRGTIGMGVKVSYI